ncbi:hypothetical protein GGR50DRAFT_376911 [Xylaria sp. CBS 124048]|nr:hypothetical protein GGR50DRAFT_376911 [Xylaria sp. CBS 124048]
MSRQPSGFVTFISLEAFPPFSSTTWLTTVETPCLVARMAVLDFRSGQAASRIEASGKSRLRRETHSSNSFTPPTHPHTHTFFFVLSSSPPLSLKCGLFSIVTQMRAGNGCMRTIPPFHIQPLQPPLSNLLFLDPNPCQVFLKKEKKKKKEKDLF